MEGEKKEEAKPEEGKDKEEKPSEQTEEKKEEAKAEEKKEEKPAEAPKPEEKKEEAPQKEAKEEPEEKTEPLGEEEIKPVKEEPVPEALAEEPEEKPEVKPPFEEEKIKPTEEEKEEELEEKAEEMKEEEGKPEEKKKEETKVAGGSVIFALRTTANREDQVMDFITSNIEKKKELKVYSVIRPHGMRGYIFVEAATKQDAEQAALNIPYARGILPKPVEYSEMEHMLEQVKHEVDIRKNDIAEIIAGPFKREQCKVTRIDKTKEEVVVELLEAAVPIPITVKMDAIKVVRREGGEEEEKD